MSHAVFALVADMFDALTHNVEKDKSNALRLERQDLPMSQVLRVQRRLVYMTIEMSMMYYMEWDAKTFTIVMKERESDSVAAPNDYEFIKDQLKSELTEMTRMFVNSVRNRVEYPKQHNAHILMGQTFRACFDDMSTHMARILDEEEQMVSIDNDKKTLEYQADKSGGFYKRSPYMLSQQLQEVMARRLVERALWWMNIDSVLNAMCDVDNGPPPSDEYEQWAFPKRADAFRLLLPVLQERMQVFGIERISRLVATEMRCLMKASRLAYLTKYPQAAWPSLDDMINSVLGATYVMQSYMVDATMVDSFESKQTLDTVPEDGEQMLDLLAELAMKKPEINVQVDRARLKSAIKEINDRTEEADMVDKALMDRMSKSSLTKVAYGLRLDEYTLGMGGARTIAIACTKAVVGSVLTIQGLSGASRPN